MKSIGDYIKSNSNNIHTIIARYNMYGKNKTIFFDIKSLSIFTSSYELDYSFGYQFKIASSELSARYDHEVVDLIIKNELTSITSTPDLFNVKCLASSGENSVEYPFDLYFFHKRYIEKNNNQFLYEVDNTERHTIITKYNLFNKS